MVHVGRRGSGSTLDHPDNLKNAVDAARRLCVAICERYGISDDDLLVFYSGSKGFHIGVTTALWQPEPGGSFNRVARRFAEHVAELAGVAIDTGVYDKVRAFRAPNSRHSKTGRHKRRLAVDALMHLSTSAIVDMANEPESFELPEPTYQSEQAVSDWEAAAERVAREAEAVEQRRAASNGAATLNRLTFRFIREGAEVGDRHRLVYSAARNLGEFGCPPALAHALLSESALDSGLPPSEVRRQIQCGLTDAGEWGDG